MSVNDVAVKVKKDKKNKKNKKAETEEEMSAAPEVAEETEQVAEEEEEVKVTKKDKKSKKQKEPEPEPEEEEEAPEQEEQEEAAEEEEEAAESNYEIDHAKVNEIVKQLDAVSKDLIETFRNAAQKCVKKHSNDPVVPIAAALAVLTGKLYNFDNSKLSSHLLKRVCLIKRCHQSCDQINSDTTRRIHHIFAHQV